MQEVTIVEIMPTQYWVDSDFLGSKHIMMQHEGMEPFCFCSFHYSYAYTSNASIHQEAVYMMGRLGIEEKDIVWKHRSL